MKYWQKLLILLFLTTFVLTAGLSYVIYRATSRISEQITITGRTILSKQAEDFLTEIIDEQANNLYLELSNIHSTLLNGAYILGTYYENYKDNQKIKDLLKYLKNEVGVNCLQAFFVNVGGYVVTDTAANFSSTKAAKTSPKKIEFSPERLERIFSGTKWLIGMDETQSSLNSKPIISAFAPIEKKGQLVGYVGLSIAIQGLVSKLNQDQIIRGSYTFLINNRRRLLAAPIHARVELTPSQANLSQGFIDLSDAHTIELKQLFNRIALGQEGISLTALRQTQKYFVYHPVGNTSWRLCISVPAAFITAPSIQLSKDVSLARDKALTENFILAAVILLLVLFIGGWFARHMTLPLLKMTALTRKIANGNFEHRIDVRRKDELGQLSDDFNKMSIQLHKLIINYENQTAQLARVNRELNEENSERMLAEAQVRTLNAELEQRVMARTAELTIAKQQAESANEAKSEFLARMSHEIRTPLNAIIGLTNVVLKSAMTDKQTDFLTKVKIASKNLLQVINDILDFSKVEAGQLDLTSAPFDLDQLMAKLTALFKEQIAKTALELNIEVDQNMPRILLGDEARLSQVLINLIQNAIKFTEKGKIKVGVALDLQPANDKGQVSFKFWVSDTGIGIETDMLPTLFQPFTQAESYMVRKHQGSGLGLSICQQIVELMGGRIWVESTPGKGSTFYFNIMLTIVEEDKLAVEKTTIKRFEQKEISHRINLLAGKRVLVVEDSELNREVAVALLEDVDLVVETAENGRIAFEKIIRSERGHYDAVFMDIQMPVLNGFEATQCIRNWESDTQSATHRIPIIALTAHALKGEREKCIEANMDDYLSKPIHEVDLHRVLVRWIALN